MNVRLNVALGLEPGGGDQGGALCTGYPLVITKCSNFRWHHNRGFKEPPFSQFIMKSPLHFDSISKLFAKSGDEGA
jgi:hypothetical protein